MQSSLSLSFCSGERKLHQVRGCIYAQPILSLSLSLSFSFSHYACIYTAQWEEGVHRPTPGYQLLQIARVKPSHSPKPSLHFVPFPRVPLQTSILPLHPSPSACRSAPSATRSPSMEIARNAPSGSFQRGRSNRVPFFFIPGVALSLSLLTGGPSGLIPPVRASSRLLIASVPGQLLRDQIDLLFRVRFSRLVLTDSLSPSRDEWIRDDGREKDRSVIGSELSRFFPASDPSAAPTRPPGLPVSPSPYPTSNASCERDLLG